MSVAPVDPFTAMLFAGGQIYASQQGNKSKTKQLPTMSKQQRKAFKPLLAAAQSRMGRWVMTPQGVQFEWNPQPGPEYPLPRVAPLTQMQQQGISQASSLGQHQQNLMQQGGPDYAKMLSQYQPGNIGALANQLQQRPQFQPQPYQFAQGALTGMLPRPDIQRGPPQYFPAKGYRPPNQQLPFVNVPGMQQMTPTPQQRNRLNFPNQHAPSDPRGRYNFFRNRAMGGPVGADDQQYLVGEVGPELHIDEMGRQNMVGEQGPEVFDPASGGFIVPNKDLSPPLSEGTGPQQQTGRESNTPPSDPLSIVAKALVPLARKMIDAGGGLVPKQEGGPVGNSADASANKTPDLSNQQTSTDFGNFDWSPYADTREDFFPTLNKYFGETPADQRSQPGLTQWIGNQPETYNWQGRGWELGPQGQKWMAPGEAGFAAPSPGANFNYGTNQWEMPLQTNPYAAGPVSGWEWNAAQNQWGPSGYDFGGTPPTTPTVTTNPQGTLPNIDPFNPDVNLYPNVTGEDWWEENYPTLWQNYQDALNEDPSYVYNPDEISEQWRQTILQPGMEDWQQDVAPWLKEQFALTGNALGSEMPRYLTRKTTSYMKTLEGERFNMLQEGRTREADALERLRDRKQSALQTLMTNAALPGQAGLIEAQTNRILNDIESERDLRQAKLGQALADIDLTRARMDEIYDQLSISNPLMEDSMKMDNMIKLAYLDSMSGTALHQEMETINLALRNISATMAIANPEQMTLQNVLTATYADWVQAVGPENVGAATDYLLQLLGMGTTENIIFQGTGSSPDLSWLGKVLAGNNNPTP